MEQDHWEKDQEPVEAQEEQAPEQAAEKWAAKDWGRVGNVSVLSAAPKPLMKEGHLVFSKNAPSVALS